MVATSAASVSSTSTPDPTRQPLRVETTSVRNPLSDPDPGFSQQAPYPFCFINPQSLLLFLYKKTPCTFVKQTRVPSPFLEIISTPFFFLNKSVSIL
jgi:hypothetical protein